MNDSVVCCLSDSGNEATGWSKNTEVRTDELAFCALGDRSCCEGKALRIARASLESGEKGVDVGEVVRCGVFIGEGVASRTRFYAMEVGLRSSSEEGLCVA